MDKHDTKTTYGEGNKNFHESMKFLLIIPQFFGLFPLHGVSNSSYKDMHFSYLSIRTIHTFLISAASVAHGVYCAYFLMDIYEPFEIYKLNVVFFYLRGALLCLAFLKLARSWPFLVKDIEYVETFLQHYPPSKFLNAELKIVTSFTFFCAAVEHFSVHSMNFIVAMKCEKTFLEIFHRFFARINYHQVFTYIQYNILLGFFLQMLNFSVTFGWTFVDIFIVHACRNFAEKLIQLKHQIYLTIKEEIKSPDTWNTMQKNYTLILKLFETFNQKVNTIILLSFATNIYFLLTQLFAWMRSNGSETTFHHVYHALSISLLVTRTALVCFYGGSIENESRNIEKVLVTMPSTLYNNQIKMFIMEVNISPMILTGNKYFQITRGLILKIAGSVVTYELIMVQFSSDISMPPENKEC